MRKAVTIRPMTFNEFDQYQDYVDELNEQGKNANKVSRLAAMWIMKTVYKIDTATTDMTPGKIMDVVTKTIDATFRIEDEEEKN